MPVTKILDIGTTLPECQATAWPRARVFANVTWSDSTSATAVSPNRREAISRSRLGYPTCRCDEKVVARQLRNPGKGRRAEEQVRE
jgi:hypothetical protein